MSASAGAATAADERTAAAVRGEIAGAQAAILIVSHEFGTREILHRELSKRYGGDYQIVACDRPGSSALTSAAGTPCADHFAPETTMSHLHSRRDRSCGLAGTRSGITRQDQRC